MSEYDDSYDTKVHLYFSYEDLSVIESALELLYAAGEIYASQEVDVVKILLAKVTNGLDHLDKESGIKPVDSGTEGMTRQ